MASRLSRRQLAAYAAQQLIDGNQDIFSQLAALLISEKRERESDLLARDIEDHLASLNELVVRVESAHQIDNQLRQEIANLFPGKTVHLKEEVDASLIGGVRLATPSQFTDQTIAKKLNDLQKGLGQKEEKL